MIKKITLFLLFCTIALTNIQSQSWTKEAGKGFYKIDLTNISSDNLLDNAGNIVPARSQSFLASSLYAEYGLATDFTVVANIPFLVQNNVSETKIGTLTLPALSNGGFGDVDIAFRYQLYKKDFALSANLILGLPTGDAKNIYGLNTGDGEFNQMLKIAAGTGKGNWWAQGALGYNHRGTGFSDEVRYDLEVGWKLYNKKILAILKVNGLESFNNGIVKENPWGLFTNNVGYLGLNPELMYYITPKFGAILKLGVAAKGRNVQAAPSISLGIFADM
jgi:hypothetical protein